MGPRGFPGPPGEMGMPGFPVREREGECVCKRLA